MSTEHASGETASRRITELVREGRSYGFTSADGTLAGGFRTLSAAAEAAALYQLGRREHPDLADAYFEGTAGDAIARAADAEAAQDPASWAWWYDAQRGQPTPAPTAR